MLSACRLPSSEPRSSLSPLAPSLASSFRNLSEIQGMSVFVGLNVIFMEEVTIKLTEWEELGIYHDISECNKETQDKYR